VKCDLHGHSVAIAGHARFCPYKQCKCRKCKNHDKLLVILGEERKIRKVKKKKNKVRKVGNGNPVNHNVKQELGSKEKKIRKGKKKKRKVIRKVGNPVKHIFKPAGLRTKVKASETPHLVKEETIYLSSSGDSDTVKDETSSSSEDELPDPEDFKTTKVLPNVLSRGYHKVNTKLSAPSKISKIVPVSVTKHPRYKNHRGVSTPGSLHLSLSSSSTSSSNAMSRPKKARPTAPVVVEITSSSSDSDSSVQEL